ncbi:MAG: glycosyltransferase [Caldilineaceae bacterium]|nr:glycosyltransferase [Caldilineaceae bacterium]
MKIGYLAQVFPHLTMTFVYREVLALRAYGLEVDTFATWRPNEAELSQEAKALVASTSYIFPIRWARFLRCHLQWLFRHPRRYVGTLLFCLRHSASSWRNSLRTLFHFGEAICLADEATRKEIDHLHVHFALNATTLAMIVARLTGITYSFTAHANDIFANPILLPEKIAAARFIVAISGYNADFLQRVVPDDETRAKIEVVRCGIDVEHFSPPSEPQEETDREAQREKCMILAVGRLVEKKGYPYLIEACKQLADQGYAFDCRIIGDGPQAEQLAQLIKENNLEDYVHLEGVVFQEGLKDYLTRAEIITLPCVVAQDQDMDGIPNSLMEGMAMGIPAVSTSISGIPELIEDNHTGLLVPPNDATALANALARLLSDHDLRDRLGKSGREKVMAEYEIQKNTRQLLNIFRARLGPELAYNSRQGSTPVATQDNRQDNRRKAIHAA